MANISKGIRDEVVFWSLWSIWIRVLGTRDSCYPAFDITYMARKPLLGHPNTRAAVLLVYLSGLSLPVAILTAEVV